MRWALGIFAVAASWLLLPSPSARAFDIIPVTNDSTDDRAADVSGSNPTS